MSFCPLSHEVFPAALEALAVCHRPEGLYKGGVTPGMALGKDNVSFTGRFASFWEVFPATDHFFQRYYFRISEAQNATGDKKYYFKFNLYSH